jgi:hypothetical protein
MDNQHRQMVGERELNQREINLFNDIQTVSDRISNLVRRMEEIRLDFTQLTPAEQEALRKGEVQAPPGQAWVDPEHMSAGRRALQTGITDLKRAITRPHHF